MLARKRQRNAALDAYRFCPRQRPADPAEKKAMKGQGQFQACDLDYFDAPARIAGLLKYKKHEWIVIAFVGSKRVYRLWWNKGADGTWVHSFLDIDSLESEIRSSKPDVIAILHNHPNSDPNRYCANLPIDADLQSARYYDNEIRRRLGVSFLEFICERGTPHLYYASFADNIVSLGPIVNEISKTNGTGLLQNYFLHKELNRITYAEQVAGPN
jgi:hypothetical protein